jgi:hypothetical protein
MCCLGLGIGNCVGHHNYKFFVLFLLYAFAFLIYVAATSLRYTIALAAVSNRSI